MSQIDGPRPSSAAAPSIWYAEAANPQVKSAGKGWASLVGSVSNAGDGLTGGSYPHHQRLAPPDRRGFDLRSDVPTARPPGERVGWQSTGRRSSLRLSTKGRSLSCPRLRAA